MVTLIILLLSFLIYWLLNKHLLEEKYAISFVGRASLSTLLLFTGIAHFILTQEMMLMLPDFVPFKIELVYLTGYLELLAAAGLVIQRTAKWTSIALMLFFIIILPANILASFKRIAFGGDGPAYLYFRIPLQIFFIWWAYYFGVRKFRLLSIEDMGSIPKRTYDIN
jgi:uncharacterized membrane protein